MAIVKGTAANNSLVGTSEEDAIYGLAGNDTLSGLGGNDVLIGGFGNDTMFGGLGNDRYVVDTVLDIVDETGGAGVDTVVSGVSHSLADNIEHLRLGGPGSIDGTGNTLDNQINGNESANTLDGGTGNDFLAGRGGDDMLVGGLGNDRLIGGIGADDMRGGAGNDIYVVDSVGDAVSELAGGGSGTDMVYSSIDLTLGANVENLRQTGAGDIDGTGNILNNNLRGNSGDNVLDGAGGKDIIVGRDGADTLRGGDGDDWLNGGNGNDHLVGGVGADRLIGNTGNDLLDVGDGAGGDVLVFGPGSGSDVVAGFDNSLLGDHDLIDVSAFGYTNFLDFTTGGGLITPNLAGGLLTSYTVQFSFAGEQAIINVTDLLGPAISPSNFIFA